jgi:hypothetical protein
VVKVATVDDGRLFPHSARLVEVLDGDLMEPQTTYGGMHYLPDTNELVAAPAVKFVPKTASKLGLKRTFDEKGQWDQIKAVITADAETQEEWDLAQEIKRTDPLVQGIIAALSLSPSQVDAILIRARELVA